MTMECPDPVIIAPTCQILCASSVLPGTCDTAYFWEPLASDFTVPAVGGSAVIAVCNSAEYAIGAYVWISGAGWFEIVGRPNVNTITVQNNGSDDNIGAGAIIAAAEPVVHCAPPPHHDTFLDNLDASSAWTPGALLDGDEVALDVACVGAALGDFVLASWSADILDLTLVGQVTVANVVTVQLLNNTGGSITLAAGTVYVRVIPK